jgi:predicted MFS family arabinose efflux permease
VPSSLQQVQVILSTPHSKEKMLIWEGLLTKIIGRTTALWIGCILCLVGDVIMMTTSSIGALYLGRFIMGVSNALFSVFGLLYIQVYLHQSMLEASTHGFIGMCASKV